MNCDKYEMRLHELTGYKNTPIGLAAAKVKPKEKGDTWALTYDYRSMRDLTDVLRDHGWKRLGGGQAGTVYWNGIHPNAVKVFMRDSEYLKYFKYVKDHQDNPHVPQVRGKTMRVGTEGLAVRIEPLTPLAGPKDPLIRKYIDPKLPFDMDYLLAPDNSDWLAVHYPDFLELIQDIYELSDTLDWHSANLMKRGNVLVITDPLAPSGQ